MGLRSASVRRLTNERLHTPERQATFSLTDMSEQNIINVAALLGTSTLTGVAAGRAALPKLVAAAVGKQSAALLDFRGFELVTASAFREAFVPVVMLLNKGSQACILVNANEVIREEATIAAERSELPLIFATTSSETLTAATVVGVLDDKLAIALDIVLREGEADAKLVSEKSGESTVTTVWNNRLVALQKMGLLRERKVGKTKFYSPVVEGMSRGS